MRIGVDLGGTKIEAIAIDDDGTTLLRRRVPTPVGDYPATLVAICDLDQTVGGLDRPTADRSAGFQFADDAASRAPSLRARCRLS